MLFATRHVGSRRWAFCANSLAASPLVAPDLRKRIYRELGMNIAPGAWEIGSRCYFHSADVQIGECTRINDYCYFENVGRLTIGNHVGLGPQVSVITSAHEVGPRSQRFGRWHYEPVTIEDGCWIGARSLILPGVTVGAGTLVAAGAVVVRDCEPSCLYGGVPARMIKRLDD